VKVRFGPFGFDSATHELRRDGEIVKLQSQPAQVLAILIERAGEVVTRDALRQAIWGDDTFVDFDKGLNFAIAQVRTALGDSAEAPTYIRTFPKRGYQFIAAVNAPLAIHAHPERQQRRRYNWLLRAGLAGAVLVVTFIAWTWTLRPAAGPAHTIAVAHFDNQTGLGEYDRYAQDLTDAVVAELTESGAGRFAIIGNAAVLRAPRDRRDLVAIGEALKAGYIVLGQVQRDGEKVRVLAHLIRLPEQTHLWVTRTEAVRPELTPPTGVAERISREFLGKL
jgi:DNA-binding winged helix-turn-helix (wHTH) protein/TolB-like protein